MLAHNVAPSADHSFVVHVAKLSGQPSGPKRIRPLTTSSQSDSRSAIETARTLPEHLQINNFPYRAMATRESGHLSLGVGAVDGSVDGGSSDAEELGKVAGGVGAGAV